jgi:hypothetical protein
VRRSIDYLHQSRLYSQVQVFNLSVLPGTAFRQEAAQLGLEFQARPPYYVLKTPTLSLEQIYDVMEEAQEAFGLEFDPWAPPSTACHCLPAPEVPLISRGAAAGKHCHTFSACCIDLDRESAKLPPAAQRAQAFTLHLQSADIDGRRERGVALARRLLDDNPHTSLDVLLEPIGVSAPSTEQTLASFLEACFSSTSYLDLYYSLHPNRLLGAKRLVVILPIGYRADLGPEGLDQIGRYGTIAWRHGAAGHASSMDLRSFEYLLP